MSIDSWREYSSVHPSVGPVLGTILLVLLSFASSSAQQTAETNSGMIGNEQIVGRVFFPKGDSFNARVLIKLKGVSSTEITGVTDENGSFRFTHLRPDQYTLVVDAGDQYERVTDMVAITNSGSVPAQGNPNDYAIPTVYPVEIYLRPKRLDPATDPAFANVPVPTRGLYLQAAEASRGGNHAKAIEQLNSVIAQAPRFALAYKDLAQEYLSVGQGAKAVETLKAGLALTPEDPALRLNYGIALVNQRKFSAAETELRAVLQKTDGDHVAAGYYLAFALLNEEKIEQAQTAFESVIKNGGDKLAMAHKYLGGIFGATRITPRRPTSWRNILS
jgi:TolA-binding protein